MHTIAMKRKILLALLVLTSIQTFAQTSPFPSGLDSTQTLKVGVNGVSTQLTSNIGATDTTFSVANCVGIVPYTLITIDQEIMDVTGCSGTVIVVDVRGFDSTMAAAHSSGALISANVDAWSVNAPDSAIIAIETALGVNLGNINTGAATTFTASATGTTPAVTQTSGNFSILGNGNATFGPVAGASFTVSATGATVAVGQSGGNFSITGSGNATFQNVTGAAASFSSVYANSASSSQTAEFENSGTGNAIYAVEIGSGYGLYAMNAGTGYAIYANNTGAGSGIYVTPGSSGTYGLEAVTTTASPAIYASTTNGSGPAVDVYNTSTGYGVRSTTTGGGGYAFYGSVTGGNAVYGIATTGDGVSGTATTGIGVYGHATGAGYGVYGIAAAANAYGGYFQSSSGTALGTSGSSVFGGQVTITPTTYGSLPTCNSGEEGTLLPITNSNTNTWGATISGTGSDHVLAYCDSSAWTVAAK